MARSLIASDNFNRAALGSNWVALNAVNGGSLSITGSTHLIGGSAGEPSANFGAASRFVGTTSPATGQVINNSGTFSNDQYAKVQLIDVNTGFGTDYFGGVLVRASGDTPESARDYYAAVVFADVTDFETRLFKVVNGTYTQLATTTGTVWADNDTISCEVEGTALRVYKNDVQIAALNATDSSLTTGKPGLIGADLQASVILLDNWEGGDVTSGGGGGGGGDEFIVNILG